MAFTRLHDEESFSEKNLICPITNKLFQDPVLAGDGRVYERAAIVQWIRERGTSPITLEPISIDDLLPEENIKQLCQREQMPVTFSTGNEEVTLSPLKVPRSPPIIAQPSIVATARRLIDNRKRSDFICFICTLIVLAIIVFIIAIPLVIRSHSSGSRPYNTMAGYSTTTSAPVNDSTTYILPNNCTLTQITPLFSLNNTAPFAYIFYSIPYTAIANQTMITFAFRQDPAYWAIDDISVRDATSGIEVLQNGDFENAIFAPFSYCDQSGLNQTFSTYSSGNQFPNSGSYAFVDFTAITPDYISQMLILSVGEIYNVTFWLQNGGGPANSFMVIMSV